MTTDPYTEARRVLEWPGASALLVREALANILALHDKADPDVELVAERIIGVSNRSWWSRSTGDDSCDDTDRRWLREAAAMLRSLAADLELQRTLTADFEGKWLAELARLTATVMDASRVELVERLRERTRRTLPHDWQIGLKCPECGAKSSRPKCLHDMGPSCPRHDPDAYDPPAWTEVPDADCHAAANLIESDARRWAQVRSEIEKLRRDGIAIMGPIGSAAWETGMDCALAILDRAGVGGNWVKDVFKPLPEEELEAQVAHLSETYTDENGTVWYPPTAWAYAQVCGANDKKRAQVAALSAEPTLEEVDAVANTVTDWRQRGREQAKAALAAFLRRRSE